MAASTFTLVAMAMSVAAQTFGTTPTLGYNSYNHVACSPNASTMTTQINAMVDRGFLAAGYNYFNLDCGWAARNGQRNASTGALAHDTDRFPNGIEPLSALARSRGLKWAMYSDAGVRMCDTQVPSPVLGSLGHEKADAALFARLNSEFVKYDNCYVDGASASQNAPKSARSDFVSRFTTMWNELKNVSIQGMVVCQWGVPFSTDDGLQGPNQWTKGISTSFRLSDDIAQGWGNIYRIYNQAIHVARSGNTGPGHFADADLLEVGNPGMSTTEQSTHFAAWAMLKSPLMVSTDVTRLSTELTQVLQNKDLVAINQDSLGKPITLVQRWTNDRDVWAGELANGDVAVLVTDLSNTQRTLALQLSTLNIASATIKDLWTGSTVSGSDFSKTVAARGSLALRLSNVRRLSTATPSISWVAASSGSVSSGANIQSCSGCTSNNKVGNLGGSSNGRLVISNIRTSRSTQSLLFDYINAEVGFLGGGNNERLASIQVNNQPARTVSFPLSGYEWTRDVYRSYAVELSGFSTSGTNTITISGSGNGFAPDLDRIGVAT